MKNCNYYFLLVFIVYGCNAGEKLNEKDSINRYDNFTLSYKAAALGSGMGSMQPTLNIVGTAYNYTFEQNSSYGEPTKRPELEARGKIRASSIDSIIDIIQPIGTKEIYKTNPNILSGTIINIDIKYNELDINFKLHNASDTTAQKIIDILNSNFSSDSQKLKLFSFGK